MEAFGDRFAALEDRINSTGSAHAAAECTSSSDASSGTEPCRSNKSAPAASRGFDATVAALDSMLDGLLVMLTCLAQDGRMIGAATGLGQVEVLVRTLVEGLAAAKKVGRTADAQMQGQAGVCPQDSSGSASYSVCCIDTPAVEGTMCQVLQQKTKLAGL